MGFGDDISLLFIRINKKIKYQSTLTLSDQKLGKLAAKGNSTLNQKLYWTEFQQLKFDSIYAEVYLENMQKWDRGISIFSAIASSSSIGGWAIFQEYSFIWASIIALSQVINAIKEFLPFKKRIKSLLLTTPELSELSLHAELNWHSVANGSLTEDDINTLRFKLKNKRHQIIKKHLNGVDLPQNKNFYIIANQLKDKYIDNYYGN